MTTSCIYPTVRALMGRENMSIKDLADRIGMPRETLSRKLSGRLQITLREATAITTLFGRRADEVGLIFSEKSDWSQPQPDFVPIMMK